MEYFLRLEPNKRAYLLVRLSYLMMSLLAHSSYLSLPSQAPETSKQQQTTNMIIEKL